jgi:hypothetical protein
MTLEKRFTRSLVFSLLEHFEQEAVKQGVSEDMID